LDLSAAQLGLPSAENQPAREIGQPDFCVGHINEEFRDERNFPMNRFLVASMFVQLMRLAENTVALELTAKSYHLVTSLLPSH